VPTESGMSLVDGRILVNNPARFAAVEAVGVLG
jgi:hypothetical protein